MNKIDQFIRDFARSDQELCRVPIEKLGYSSYSINSIRSSIVYYVQTRTTGVKLFQRDKEIYLAKYEAGSNILEHIPEKRSPRKYIERFLSGSNDTVKVLWDKLGYLDAQDCRNSIAIAIGQLGYTKQIGVSVSQGEVWMFRKVEGNVLQAE